MILINDVTQGIRCVSPSTTYWYHQWSVASDVYLLSARQQPYRPPPPKRKLLKIDTVRYFVLVISESNHIFTDTGIREWPGGDLGNISFPGGIKCHDSLWSTMTCHLLVCRFTAQRHGPAFGNRNHYVDMI